MKLSTTTLLSLFLFISSFSIRSASAQMEQGTIMIELTEVGSDNAQMAAQLEMLKGSELNIHFTKEKSLVSTVMLGGMSVTNKLTDTKSGQSQTFMDMMGNKFLIEDDGKKPTDPEIAEAMKGMKIEYDKNETKEILGYECYKATITGFEQGVKMDLYVTPDLKVNSDMINGLEGVELEGFPLEFTMDVSSMNMTYVAQSISKEVDTSVFEIDEEGYQKMTLEEFTEKMGSMGGMGF